MASPTLLSTPLESDQVARTLLPIEFMGREIALEARAYQGAEEAAQAVALVHRDEGANSVSVPVVRVHSGCVTGDVFHSLRCDCYAQLKAALGRITSEPYGVLIYLPYQEGRGIGLYKKIRAYALQDQGRDTVDANLEQGEPADARDYAFAAQILADLGICKVRLMTNNPDKIDALEQAGIEIVERISVAVSPSTHNKAYLDTKRRRMSHKI